MNIAELLDERANEMPDKIALTNNDEYITFAKLRNKSLSLAGDLQRQGVLRGQRALLAIPLNIELYLIFVALMRVQATVVLVDPTVGKVRLTQCLTDVVPDIFIGIPKAHLLRYMPIIRRIPIKFVTRGWLPLTRRISDNGCQFTTVSDTDNETSALITFTSGSTGKPKAIDRTHGFLQAQHRAIENTLGHFPDDVELNTLPVFILSSLASGMTVSLPEASLDNPEVLLAQIKQKSINRILASPAFCQQLVHYLENQKQTEPNIERIYTGGGPVFPNLLLRLQTVFPNAQINAVYGSTEAEPIAHHHYQLSESKANHPLGLLAGKPCETVQVAIIEDRDGTALPKLTPDEFGALQCASQQAGEIVVTGAHVQKSYLNNDGKQTKISVGDTVWHRTGDTGLLDEGGNLWLQGRCSAKIEREVDGEKTIIYPFSLESIAMSITGVSRAGIIAIGEEIVLAIEILDNAKSTQGDIETKLKQHSALKSLINRVVCIEKIPVDSRHKTKVLYPKLRKILESGDSI